MIELEQLAQELEFLEQREIILSQRAKNAMREAARVLRSVPMPPSKYRDLIIESCAQRIEMDDVLTTAATYFAKFLRETKGGK